MKRKFWRESVPAVLTVTALVLTAAAWQGHPGKAERTLTDTIPQRNKSIRSIDDALDQLDKSSKELQRTLEAKDWDREMKEALDKTHFDAEKIKAQIDEAIKNVDAKKIQDEVQRAIKDVDVEKIKTEWQQNLDNVDLQQMKEQIETALKQVDVQKIKADMNASLAKIDMEKIKLELDKMKDVDLKGMEDNLKKMRPDIEKSMQNAKESVERARKELLEHKAFIDGLDKDGLINKNDNYTIEYRNGELMINGKKQPAEVLKRYSGYLKDRRDFTIKKDEAGFNIEKDQ